MVIRTCPAGSCHVSIEVNGVEEPFSDGWDPHINVMEVLMQHQECVSHTGDRASVMHITAIFRKKNSSHLCFLPFFLQNKTKLNKTKNKNKETNKFILLMHLLEREIAFLKKVTINNLKNRNNICNWPTHFYRVKEI